MTSSSNHLVDDLEASFQNCIAGLTSQEFFNLQDNDEIKAGADQCLVKFLELARQTEAFFLHKRLILSKQRPEQLLKDEIEDLKVELERKDQLIKRHQDKLQEWQAKLKQINKGHSSVLPPNAAQIPPQIPMGPPHQHHPSQHTVYGGHMPGQTQMGLPGPGPSQGMTMGPGQGFHHPGQMPSSQPPHMMIQRQGSGPGPGPGHQMGPHQPPPPAYPQGPLQFLEQTMSNIGMPDRR